MSGIGPELPPHLLAKRKRKQQEEADYEVVAHSGAKRSPSPGDGEKRRRVVGPAMPPAPLNERPEEPLRPAQDSDSDDDDDFGPALPPDGEDETETAYANGETGNDALERVAVQAEEKPQRDEWMKMPPKQDDLAARMDPSKQRARGFNTGKGARAPNAGGDDSSSWHETPEEKRKRLADEMMGVSKASSTATQRQTNINDASRDSASAQVRERTEKARGPSLLDQHQGSKTREPDDDPSKRAFDREKDMGSGMKIGHAQRKEMLNKAANFSSKFSSGSYL